MESLFKSVAIIGKYASDSESSDIKSQLLELAQYLTQKQINIFIEAKTHQSGNFQAFKSIASRGYWNASRSCDRRGW